MSCRRVRSLFSGRLDRALSAAEEGGLAAHLGACPACAARWERYVRVLAIAAEAASPAALPGAAELARRARAGEARLPLPRAASVALAWGIPLLAFAWFSRAVADALSIAVPIGPETLPLHAVAWGVLYVAFALGFQSLLFTGDLVGMIRWLWRLRGEPAGSAMGSLGALRGLGAGLLAFAGWGTSWYGVRIFVN